MTRNSIRGPAVCLVAGLACACVRAQAPDFAVLSARWNDAEVTRRLASQDSREVAWAAHRVVQRGLRAAVPAVRRALSARAGTEDSEQRIACLCLLDALIRFDVRVPGEELLAHAHDFLTVPTLILAARSPLQNTEFFATLMAGEPEGSLVWNACGNLLAAHRAPGFAAACLQGFEPVWSVDVVDSDKPKERGPVARRATRLQTCCVFADFPILAEYRLCLDPRDGPVFAPGRVPVSWARSEGFLAASGDLAMESPDEIRAAWLADLLGRGELPLSPHAEMEVRFRGAILLRTELVRRQRVYARRFFAVADELVVAGALTAAERARVAPRIDLQIEDRRSDQRAPLPRVPVLPEGLPEEPRPRAPGGHGRAHERS